jgi:hypothetical protein
MARAIMVDLETLSQSVNAVIVSIGAVEFDPGSNDEVLAPSCAF